MDKFILFIESLFPKSVVLLYRKLKRRFIWERQNLFYKKELAKLQSDKSRSYNVVFLVLYASVWKYDSIYNQMLNDSRFNPMILICPVVDRSHEYMMETLKGTRQYFQDKGYNTICAYNEHTDCYIDLSELAPDILMYAFQWQSHVVEKYNVFHTTKYLKCYVNYSYKNNPFEWSIASQPQSLMWLYFSECEMNKTLIQSYSHWKNEFQNVRVVGYPMYDEFCKDTINLKDWKNKNTKFKRIIWAPHHTIEGDDYLIKLSTFLLYSEFMKELAVKYKDKIQIAFKPHPELKPALYKHKNWGKEKTDKYYEFWATSENTSYIMGNYVDLFKSSDALIHDCHSFTVEYLYMNKPVMFMTNFDRASQCNEVGKMALNCHYQGQTTDDIESFVVNVVLGNNDTMKNVRSLFYNNVLLPPPPGLSVAENIINCITSELHI